MRRPSLISVFSTDVEGLVVSIAEGFARYTWPYASQDGLALGEIARRVARTGRNRELVPYSKLVDGISFRLASVHSGEPVSLGVPDWIDLHRAILGDFLGRLCLATYERGGFMGSALVISGASDRPYPSDGFRQLMHELGVLRGRGDDDFLEFWAAEVGRAHEWYVTNQW
jgi:hypothetical protein